MKLKKDLKITERFVWNHINALIIVLSILIAILILRSELINNFINSLNNLKYFGIFIAGLFFSYGFTTAPAISVLYLLAEDVNVLLVAIIGSIGAIISDFLIFSFVKYKVTKEIKRIEREINFHPKFRFIKMFKKIAPFIGGLVIASPLPDEIAATIFGAIKFDNKKFLIIAFFAKFISILIIASLAKLI